MWQNLCIGTGIVFALLFCWSLMRIAGLSDQQAEEMAIQDVMNRYMEQYHE